MAFFITPQLQRIRNRSLDGGLLLEMCAFERKHPVKCILCGSLDDLRLAIKKTHDPTRRTAQEMFPLIERYLQNNVTQKAFCADYSRGLFFSPLRLPGSPTPRLLYTLFLAQ